MKFFKIGAMLGSAMLLVACGGEPSESDIRAVMEKDIKLANEQMSSLGSALGTGTKMETKLHSVKKIGCKADGDKAYLCDVEMDVEAPLVGRRKAVAPMRLIKASEGWAITR